MSTIEGVAALFKYGEAKLPPIPGNPTKENLKHLRKILSNLLQAAKLPWGTDA